ncbi:MAG: peptidase M3 [Planctomycetes bacterium]|nr:peptidase M3 [Planctomycetota bacterium]
MKIRIILTLLCLTIAGCQLKPTIDTKPEKFIKKHISRLKPVEKESAIAYWAAATTGKSEDYARAGELDLEIRKMHSDPDEFAYLKAIRKIAGFEDPLVARQIDRLYYRFLGNQIDESLIKETVELSSKIEEKFSTFRSTSNGKELTGNEIKAILKTETDSTVRRLAWAASKQVAPVIADDIIWLVILRNRAARSAGFDNYHTMKLHAGEQDPVAMDKLFAELDALTAAPFKQLKDKLDSTLAKKYGIEVSEMKPWHYHDPFFQEVPMVQEIDLDVYYKGKDIKELSAIFFNGIGLNVDAILEKSDLYDRKGKNPHAFCTDIDKKGDVRILCNIEDNEYWMTVQLHELGHAVYFKYNDPKVPYMLRDPAHSYTTEAIAMLFGRLSKDSLWMQQMLGLSDAQRQELLAVTAHQKQLSQLIFARWAMVMYNFEKKLYADPDQDLNSLWWDIVEKYQFIKRPAGRDQPDWAAKIHFTIAPCYYHNYMLGELLASQLHHDMAEKITSMKTDKGISYVGRTEIADYLRKNIFEPGNIYQHNEMIKRATGEYLTPKYFVEDFVK